MKKLMIVVKDLTNIDCLKQYGSITFTWDKMNYVEMKASEDAIQLIKECGNVVSCEVSKEGKYQPYLYSC